MSYLNLSTNGLSYIYKVNDDESEDGPGENFLKGEIGPNSDPNKDSNGKIEWKQEAAELFAKHFKVSHIFVKDGNNSPIWAIFKVEPSYVLFDATSGIIMSGFWNDVNGDISHVELYGTIHEGVFGQPPPNVPEPLTLGLMASGMACAGFVIRKRRKN